MLQLYYNILTEEYFLSKIKITQYLSISATVITLVGIAYAGIATTWGLPFGSQVYDTAVIITSAISAVLGGTTIKKLVDANHNGIPDSEEGLAPVTTLPEPESFEEDGKVDEFSEKN